MDKFGKRVLNGQPFNPLAVVQVFAVEAFAAGAEGGGDDQRMNRLEFNTAYPGTLLNPSISTGLPPGVEKFSVLVGFAIGGSYPEFPDN